MTHNSHYPQQQQRQQQQPQQQQRRKQDHSHQLPRTSQQVESTHEELSTQQSCNREVKRCAKRQHDGDLTGRPSAKTRKIANEQILLIRQQLTAGEEAANVAKEQTIAIKTLSDAAETQAAAYKIIAEGISFLVSQNKNKNILNYDFIISYKLNAMPLRIGKALLTSASFTSTSLGLMPTSTSTWSTLGTLFSMHMLCRAQHAFIICVTFSGA